MNRSEAVELIVQRDLAQLSTVQREDLLIDFWGVNQNDPEYADLDDQLKVLMASSEEPVAPESAIYDPLLKFALRYLYIGVVNAYLQEQTATLGCYEVIVGEVEKLAACPCCGYCSLHEEASYDICRVCFWEDDGISELDRSSGPNHMTLRTARSNFEKIGAVEERVREYVLPDGKQRFVSTLY